MRHFEDRAFSQATEDMAEHQMPFLDLGRVTRGPPQVDSKRALPRNPPGLSTVLGKVTIADLTLKPA